MSSKKKASEGIALLSMYNDEEEEEEEEEEDDDNDEEMEDVEEAKEREEQNGGQVEVRPNDDERAIDSDSGDNTPLETSTPREGAFVPPVSNLQVGVGGLEVRISRREKLTIVDYGHDEVAMSPEAEEGEIESGGRVMFGTELQNSNGDLQEKTPPGTVQVLTPGVATPRSSEPQESSQHDTTSFDVNESAAEGIQELVKVSLKEPKDVDLLDNFLPPLPPGKKACDDLQKKINKFLLLKKEGNSFNAAVRNNKDYRNPDFLLHAVSYQDIDQIGSCFSKDVFDPHGYDKSDYYDEIEADMKREAERKEQERKKSQKLDFVSGVIQPGSVTGATKINIPIAGVSTGASSGFHSVQTTADAVTRDGRQNKKSKWDKVDGDGRNPLSSGGKDSASLGTHASLLSAANAGAGYTAFAQQRRREAEQKRSSERKLDRRS